MLPIIHILFTFSYKSKYECGVNLTVNNTERKLAHATSVLTHILTKCERLLNFADSIQVQDWIERLDLQFTHNIAFAAIVDFHLSLNRTASLPSRSEEMIDNELLLLNE